MSYIEEIKKKIPERFHPEPDFQALIEIAENNNLNSKLALLEHLNKEIKQVEDWLKKNEATGGTIVIHLRDKTLKLGTLKACKKYVDDYL